MEASDQSVRDCLAMGETNCRVSRRCACCCRSASAAQLKTMEVGRIAERSLTPHGPDPESYRSQNNGAKRSGAEGRKLRGEKKRNPLRFNQPFIAWDGEGYSTPDGTHHYMMLVASTGDYLLAPEGRSLSTRECFNLLLRVASQNPKHNHVIFGGGYDFNMMLSQFSKQDCERLHTQGHTYFGPYRLEHRKRKSVNLLNRDTGEHVIVYDVWPFFQTSFVKTLDAWGVVDDVAKIVGGKAQRGNFEYANHKEILTYCRAELVALVNLMETFRDGLREAGIVIDRWDGPGAVAGALYRTHKTKTHKADMEGKWLAVNKASQRAYFGGRIETLRFGNYEGGTHYYDINSAYPYAISQLPSLAGGKWIHSLSTNPPPTPLPLSLYHLEWDFSQSEPQAFYPLPFRRPDGTIAFFPKGKGWFHSPEYELVRQFFPGQYRVLDSWKFQPSTKEKPFQWVEEMYALRKEWKNAGRGEEKILKLGMNSLYGKMVQQLGWRKDRGLPPYHQLEWGGYVTSYTRSMLYRAAASSPDSIVGFETDGIISTEPLTVNIGPALGDWSLTPYSGLTYVQPGVYWLRNGDTWEAKYRGFDPHSLTREDVLTGWRLERPSVTALSTRFVGIGLALMEDWRLWRRWETRERELSIWPDNPKRIHPVGDCRGVCRPIRGPGSRAIIPGPAEALHKTAMQWDNPGYWTGEESEPYPLQWRPERGARYTFAMMMEDHDSNDLYMEDL